MRDFITLQKSGNTFLYFFSKQHFLILLISLVFIIFFSMYITRQKLHSQKIAVVILSSLFIILECLKIFWRYKFLQFNNENLSFENVTNLDFFTLSLWISVPLCIYYGITKKKESKNSVLLYFVFSLATLFGIITLVYPNNINTNFDFYHCYNLIYILEHSIIITLGFVFAFSRWISTKKFLDLGKALLCNISFLIIAYLLGHFAFSGTNTFYVEYSYIFDYIGVHIGFPLHYIVLCFFIFLFQIFIFLPFFISQNKKKRGWLKIHHKILKIKKEPAFFGCTSFSVDSFFVFKIYFPVLFVITIFSFVSYFFRAVL